VLDEDDRRSGGEGRQWSEREGNGGEGANIV